MGGNEGNLVEDPYLHCNHKILSSAAICYDNKTINKSYLL